MVLDVTFPSTLHPRVLGAIRTEGRQRVLWRPRLMAAVAAVVVIALAAGAVYGAYAWRLTPQHGGPRAPSIVPTVANTNKNEAVPEPAPLMREAQAPTTQPAFQSTTLHFRVAGTVQGPTPQAIIVNTETGQQALYKEGDTLAPGVQIKDISSGQVTLDVNGQTQTLSSGALTASALNVQGSWNFVMEAPDQDKQTGQATIAQDGTRLKFILVDSPKYSAEGTLSGTQAKLNYADESHKYEITGTFTPDGNKLTGNVRVENLGDSPSVWQRTMTAERIQEQNVKDAIAAKMQTAALLRELKQMFEPLGKYALAHNDQFPTDVSVLAPDYTSNIDVYKSTSTRIVSYDPSVSAKKPEIPTSPNFYEDETRAAERMIAFEAELEQKWGGPIPVSPVVLTLEYTDPPLRGVITAGGGARVIQDSSALASQAGSLSEQVYSAWRVSDQNNLKELGLVIKRFQNESRGEYVPAGWCMTYPEYLTDPNVLTSPWDPPVTPSYDLLFPAWSQEDLMALHEQIRGPSDPNNPAANAKAESEIPMTMDKSDEPGPVAGRNILFLDGHVAFYRTPSWQEELKPFLDIAHR
jgi:prepilin-type processing-associated H-X9-DG protein